MRSWKSHKKSEDNRLLVRVIPYTLDDPVRNPDGQVYRLITSLLEPSLCPAKKVIDTYHQR